MGAFPNGGVGGVLVAVAKLGLVLKIFVLQGQRQLGGDKVALGRHGDGLPQTVGQALQTNGCAGVEQVAVHRLRQGQLVRNAVQAGGQNQPYNEIGVAGRVRPAQLHTAQVTAGAGQAHQLAAVLAAPAHIQRGFVGAQPGVRIGDRVAESRQLPGVGQDARHEIPGLAVGDQVAFKQVFAVPHKRHIYMQAVAALVVQGLGHKAGIQAVAGGNGFDSAFESV